MTASRRGRIFSAASAAALACALLPRVAACAPAKEAEVKAAYIYNFAQFVDWENPAASSAPAHFDICVLGEDAVNQPLSFLPETSLKGQKTRVRLLGNSEEALASCRILFIGRSKQKRAAEIARALRPAGVLTVSDAPRFAAAGGVIGFLTENNRVRIAINLKAARESRLRISSRLLEVSKLVQEQP